MKNFGLLDRSDCTKNLAVFVHDDVVPLNGVLLQLLDHRAGGVDVR